MGFFKSLGRAIGRGIENVGNFFGSSRISNFGRSIQEACSERISHERSYDRSSSSIHTTERLVDTLSAFSSGHLSKAELIEERCIAVVEDYYDDIIKLLEDAPSDSVGKTGLRRLKNARTKIRQNIAGSIKEPLAKRMSIDDTECCQILKMDAGEQKRTAMESFCQKVIRESLNNISKKVRRSLEEQLEDVEDYLKNIHEEQERKFYELKYQFGLIAKKGNMEKYDKEKFCIKPAVTFQAAKLVEGLLQ